VFEMETFAELLEEANGSFDKACQDRHAAGAKKYGSISFFDKNTVEEAMDEVVDMANYMRYTYVKLYIMNVQLDATLGVREAEEPFRPSVPDMDPSRPQMTTDEKARSDG
jgi:hypothetical protein